MKNNAVQDENSILTIPVDCAAPSKNRYPDSFYKALYHYGNGYRGSIGK